MQTAHFLTPLFPALLSLPSWQRGGQPYIRTPSTCTRGMQKIYRRSPSRNETQQVYAFSAPSVKQYDPRALSPSRLRYVGAQVTKRVSPSDLLCGTSVAKFHERGSPKSLLTSLERATVPTTFSVDHESVSTALASPCHPLLQQVLLLIEAAEVEERLAFSQEEMDSFESIITSLNVAREVEVIRVAAFELFHIERAFRRAVKRQERHERRILQRWYCESFADTLLSEEVRIIRRQSEEARSVFSGSSLRSGSTSVRRQIQEPLDVIAHQIRPSLSRSVPRSTKFLAAAPASPLQFSEPRQRGKGARDSSPTEICSEVPHGSTRVSSPMISNPSFPQPVGLSRSLSVYSDSVNVVDGRQYNCGYGGHRQSTVGGIEAELEARIARQEALLLPARQSYQK
ncbi:hypothetical protein LSCM1_03475 [Leishmania martiniquensis]|uniref:Uncharacterized protein n=1 Tax=Leishmania martiniquensis TaxID=1580590 RepID=A0A836G564_9TRYP|nr:hypothetical protein LSCM1_03475 [Leishmania martiniquensis]